MSVRPNDDNSALSRVEAQLLVRCIRSLRHTDIRDIVCVDVVVVVAEDLGHGIDVDLVLCRCVDRADGEVLGVRQVALEERDIGDILSSEGGQERPVLFQIGRKVCNRLAGLLLDTGEDENAERAVRGHFLLQCDGVRVCQPTDGAGGECASGNQSHAGDAEQFRLGGVALIPSEDVALVGDTVAASELARGLERLDELVLVRRCGLGVAGFANLAGCRTTLLEQRCVLRVEVQQGLGNVFALAFVCAQNRPVCQSGLHRVQLPRHVQSVVESSVHTLTGLGL